MPSLLKAAGLARCHTFVSCLRKHPYGFRRLDDMASGDNMETVPWQEAALRPPADALPVRLVTHATEIMRKEGTLTLIDDAWLRRNLRVRAFRADQQGK